MSFQTSIEVPNNSITGAQLAANAEIAASQLAQRPLMAFPVKLTDCRVWDAMATMVVGTPASDDLALITGTPGTNAPRLSAGDLKAAGATTRRVGFELEVPANYQDGETILVRIRAGMETTIASSSATVDLLVWKPNNASVGSDLVTTAAQSINSLTPNNYDFVIDATGVDPGDRLICNILVAVNDAATATAVTAIVYAISLLCDTRG